MAKLSFNDTVRQLSQPLLLPIVKVLANLKIHPNIITILCFTGFVISSYFIACGKFLIAGILLLIFAPLDAIDGALARFSNQVTHFGAFLDSTLDRYGEIFVFLAFTYYFLINNLFYGVLLSFLGITGSLMVSYTRARAEGAGFECKIGFLTRFERLFLLILALLFDFCTLFLIFISIFTHFTALQRILYVYKQYKQKKR
ncbi:CDP-alcohol phosphatidyltransferase family protein [Thermodesulfobacterium hydrogeniphilum]|uniref:CDP-alcohol phosphatidyltransferase family protein n=1 Tax=Thermodesulfobacterium hydrogeniphilum TaxID=161156 RepID=UPI0005710313|nr:CDP-alcohol phosphatidyltransferase family protein [Thermodesulfobacterium hydrogeniphilum]